jgi:hypothetical protein
MKPCPVCKKAREPNLLASWTISKMKQAYRFVMHSTNGCAMQFCCFSSATFLQSKDKLLKLHMVINYSFWFCTWLCKAPISSSLQKFDKEGSEIVCTGVPPLIVQDLIRLPLPAENYEKLCPLGLKVSKESWKKLDDQLHPIFCVKVDEIINFEMLNPIFLLFSPFHSLITWVKRGYWISITSIESGYQSSITWVLHEYILGMRRMWM